MTTTIIDFKYSIKDEVGIRHLNVAGIVIGLYYGDTGTQYQVSYFSEGTIRTTYLYEEQIREPKGSDLGFL